MLEVVEESVHAGELVSARYRLIRVVGEGGMGVVWSAHDVRTGESVALKFLRAEKRRDRQQERRLLREAKVAGTLRHAHIARVRDVGETESGTLYLVMDLLEGETLAARLRRGGPLAKATFCSLLIQVVRAVRAAHEADVVHRDLKPENIFLVGKVDAERPVVRVLDFGIAKAMHTSPGAVTTDTDESSLTATGTMLGTPYYMAPEQIFGDSDVDGRADIWSLGVVMYECLTGSRPTQASGMGQVIKRIMQGSIPSLRANAHVPRALAAIVDRMMDRDRERRPALEEVESVLEAAETQWLARPDARRSQAPRPTTEHASGLSTTTLDSHEVYVEPKDITPPVARSTRPHTARRAVAVVLALSGLGVGWWLQGPPPSSSHLSQGSREASHASRAQVDGNVRVSASPPPTDTARTRDNASPHRPSSASASPPREGWDTHGRSLRPTATAVLANADLARAATTQDPATTASVPKILTSSRLP